MASRRSLCTGSLGLAAAISSGFGIVRQARAAGKNKQHFLHELSVPVLPVRGSHMVFPVRRIYCVGRNYLAHVEELHHDVRDPPFFFHKARDMLVQSGSVIPYPVATHDYEHEVELVLAMKSGGLNIPAAEAMNHIYGYAVGLDMTRRDQQAQAQEKRHPWEAGKSFDNSAPCSAIVPVSSSGYLQKGRIHLELNGTTVADGDLGNMIWNTAEIITRCSEMFEIAAGDLIYTGTPKSVGKVNPGDRLSAHIEGLAALEISVSA